MGRRPALVVLVGVDGPFNPEEVKDVVVVVVVEGEVPVAKGAGEEGEGEGGEEEGWRGLGEAAMGGVEEDKGTGEGKAIPALRLALEGTPARRRPRGDITCAS